jgi:hypothetical protein
MGIRIAINWTALLLSALASLITSESIRAQDYHCDSCLVYGIGAYHSQGSTIDIGKSTRPLVLVCSNYDSTVWKVSNADSALIRLVILYGTEGAAIEGTGNAPVLKRPFPSGSAVFEFEGQGYADLEAYVVQTVGKSFTRFQSSLSTAAFMITEPEALSCPACRVLGASIYGASQGGTLKVELGASKDPLILLFTAYAATTWEILNPAHTEIKEIWISGYEPGEVRLDGNSVRFNRFYPHTKLLSSAVKLTGQPLAHYETLDRADSIRLEATVDGLMREGYRVPKGAPAGKMPRARMGFVPILSKAEKDGRYRYFSCKGEEYAPAIQPRTAGTTGD